MMKILLGVFTLLMVAGPLRKPLIEAWRIVVPLAAGAIIGLIVVVKLMPSASGWMMIARPLRGAAIICTAVKEFFDNITDS
jgi:hypothetical protein